MRLICACLVVALCGHSCDDELGWIVLLTHNGSAVTEIIIERLAGLAKVDGTAARGQDQGVIKHIEDYNRRLVNRTNDWNALGSNFAEERYD